MYSMVLMMALSTGASEPVTFFGNGCHGGCTGAACNGSACHGSACHGGFLFGKGCHGGCNGSACNGSACHGGFLFGKSCHGGCNGGGFLFGKGCHGGCYGACHGGMKVEPVPVKPGEKPKDEVSNQATIIVNIPAGAKLSFDNTPTASMANVRTFVSPTLEVGKDYVYTLKAEITVDGKIETVVKEITVRANETTRITMDAAAVTTAAK